MSRTAEIMEMLNAGFSRGDVREQIEALERSLAETAKERDEALRIALRVAESKDTQTCAHCGFTDAGEGAYERLKAHVMSCPKHPSTVYAEKLAAVVRDFINWRAEFYSPLDGPIALLGRARAALVSCENPANYPHDAGREAVARWMIARGYATGHGDTLDDLLRHLVDEAKTIPEIRTQPNPDANRPLAGASADDSPSSGPSEARAPGPDGEVTITTNDDGECVAVTRTDDEGRILSVLWERPEKNPPSMGVEVSATLAYLIRVYTGLYIEARASNAPFVEVTTGNFSHFLTALQAMHNKLSSQGKCCGASDMPCEPGQRCDDPRNYPGEGGQND